jgi:hypothetical protein
MESSPLGAEITRENPSYPLGTNPRVTRWDKVDSALMLRPNNYKYYNYFMVIAKYVWEGVKNYRDVARTIPRLDIPEGERKFLAKSLVNTRMYEYGFFGGLYYRLGEGVAYTREVIKATGDYFFFLRVLDDMVDGHITGHKVDRKVAKSLARACKDYLVGVYDESEFKNNLSCSSLE